MRFQNVLWPIAGSVLSVMLYVAPLVVHAVEPASAHSVPDGLIPATGGVANVSPSATDNSDPLVIRGKYLAVAADCAACHTVANGQPFAGGLDIETPIGRIVSTNITPSRTAGIGGYTLEQFNRAIRRGVRADGMNLYPAMPYTAYAKLTDDDVKALYAYFMKDVAAVDRAPAHSTDLPFPFNIRISMAIWNRLFLDDTPFEMVAGKSAEWNRGAYLAEALGHCQTCHTPRNFLMAEKTGSGLSGASLGTWYAPNITSDKATGIGMWSDDDIFSYLKTGHAAVGSQAGGPMREAIDKSFSKLDDGDLRALATWVKSVPAIRSGKVDKGNIAQHPIPNDLTLMSGSAEKGAVLYADNCASCHQASGQGARGLPALVGNAAFSRPVADNVIMAILDGMTPASGQDMPGFAEKLSDGDIADLTNYLFRQFGVAEIQTNAAHVTQLRAGGPRSPLLLMARVGLVAVLLIVLLLVFIAMKRRRHVAR
ncbi:cytochrome c [Robbsia andropogonis]|uniref:cytochrome c n=1 Tax=Robbsia andropogonis TaxID=28092 RepID=UPI0004653FE4|nr:cytochrome c [Robbsia andropogonis]MCP1118149.1 cytochrome c [Robbsia andropogonis]MCP1127570.1 cytochrome c [Robbsia andropogonis]